MSILTDHADVRRVLSDARRIVVLGASRDPDRPGHYVTEYLHEAGYEIIPINPGYTGQPAWGTTYLSSLSEVTGPIDIVDVFRRPDQLPKHVGELLAMTPRPTTVWFQLGARDDAISEQLSAAGFQVVHGRCTMADHRAFGLPRRG